MVQTKKGIGDKMAAKKKQFIILAVTAACLLTVYLAVSMYSDWKAEKEAEEEAAELQVTDLKSDDMIRLSYTDGDSQLSFSKEDGTWYYDGDRELPLNQSTVENALDTYTAVSGTRKLDSTGAEEDYGFGSPEYTVTMEDDSGNITEIKIGDMTGEEYYITADDSKTVYTVAGSITDAMVFDEDSLIQYETFPSIYESIFESIVVTENGKTLLEYEAGKDEDKDEDEDEEESMSEIYSGEVGSIYFDDCVDYNAGEDELALYGLDASSRKEIVVKYEDVSADSTETVEFYMGDKIENGDEVYIYIKLADSKMVYKVDASDMENLLAL